MATLIFEEVGGDCIWFEVDEATNEILVWWHGACENDYKRTLVCGGDVPAFLGFFQNEYANALRKVKENEEASRRV